MQTETLTAAVHDSCPELNAARVSQCTLIAIDAIAEHLDANTGKRVADGLPDEAGRALRSGASRADTTGQAMKLAPFLDKIRTRTELPREQSDALTYAVAITLSHRLDEKHLDLLREGLPGEIDRLFRD